MLSFMIVLLGLALIASPGLLRLNILTNLRERINLKWRILLPLIGIGLMLSNGAFFYASPGEYYLVQYIWGTQKVKMTPGPGLKFWGETIKFKKVLTIKQSVKKGTASRSVGPVAVRFNDSVTANVSVTTRWQMPSDKETFKTLAIDFRSQDNLIDNSLIPMTRQIGRNSARLISAQDYISGKGGDFEFALRDQMENGQYQLVTEEVDSKGNKKIAKLDTSREIDSDKVVRYKVKKAMDANKQPIRLALSTTKYKIALSDLNVEDVDTDDTFDNRLDEQRKAAAEGNIAKQKATKAEFDKQRIVAEGERDKAEEQAKQEKLQVTELIKEETALKKASIEKKKAAISLETSRLTASATKVKADAEAYKKKAIMLADGALELKLKALVEINKNYANALKAHKTLVPQTVIGNTGKGTGSSMDLVNLLTAQTAKQLQADLTPKK